MSFEGATRGRRTRALHAGGRGRAHRPARGGGGSGGARAAAAAALSHVVGAVGGAAGLGNLPGVELPEALGGGGEAQGGGRRGVDGGRRGVKEVPAAGGEQSRAAPPARGGGLLSNALPSRAVTPSAGGGPGARAPASQRKRHATPHLRLPLSVEVVDHGGRQDGLVAVVLEQHRDVVLGAAGGRGGRHARGLGRGRRLGRCARRGRGRGEGRGGVREPCAGPGRAAAAQETRGMRQRPGRGAPPAGARPRALPSRAAHCSACAPRWPGTASPPARPR